MNNGKKEFTFLWIIENYAYCWSKNAEGLRSPDFTFSGFKDTSWRLHIFPKGYEAEDTGNVSLCLVNTEKDADQEAFKIKFELSLIAADGSVLHSKNSGNSEHNCNMFNGGEGFRQFIQTYVIHFRRKADYLPNDNLTVRCKMWIGEGDIQNAEQISGRTRIMTEQISFFHEVQRFSKLLPNVKKTINTPSWLQRDREISSSLYYTEGSCGEDKIVLEIVSSDAEDILHKCKLSLVNKSAHLIPCGGFDYVYDDQRLNMHKLPLFLTREFVMNRKSEYLINGAFSLLCECTLTTGLIFWEIEGANRELPLAVIKQERSKADKKNVCKAPEKVSEYTSALEDMKALYISQRLTDVELKTKTKSFPAHKIVLCARSPVFEAMLTTDMKEKITSRIEIDDLEDDIVEQLLLFLYSDSLDTLQWKSATQLYYAADKYQIGKLKAVCSSFLEENLSISNASELLLLCDTHNDSDLLKVVEDYILKYEEQVFCSNGWENLKETNPQLALKTMCLKYERRNEVN